MRSLISSTIPLPLISKALTLRIFAPGCAPLDEIMRKMVIESLGIKDSSMVWRAACEIQAAVGHDSLAGTTGELRRRTQPHAAASLYTTAADYARFVAALMSTRILSKSTVDQMLTPQVEVGNRVSWGLGFGLNVRRTERPLGT